MEEEIETPLYVSPEGYETLKVEEDSSPLQQVSDESEP